MLQAYGDYQDSIEIGYLGMGKALFFRATTC